MPLWIFRIFTLLQTFSFISYLLFGCGTELWLPQHQKRWKFIVWSLTLNSQQRVLPVFRLLSSHTKEILLLLILPWSWWNLPLGNNSSIHASILLAWPKAISLLCGRYPYEVLRVTTADGYILLLERIPRYEGKESTDNPIAVRGHILW